VMVGLMLWQAASATIKTAEAQLVAEKMRLTDLMTPVRTILANASISMLIPLLSGSGAGREYQQLHIAALQLCEDTGDGGLVGLVVISALSTRPRRSWQPPVSAVSRSVDAQDGIGF